MTTVKVSGETEGSGMVQNMLLQNIVFFVRPWETLENGWVNKQGIHLIYVSL